MSDRHPLRQIAGDGATNGQVPIWNAEHDRFEPGDQSAGAGVIRMAVFKFNDPLAVATGITLMPNDDGADRTILSVRALCEVAPTGGDEVVDVNIDGTTIFTTQANRPTIADGTTNSGKNTDAEVTTWPDGSYLSFDVDEHTDPCAGLQIMVTFQ